MCIASYTYSYIVNKSHPHLSLKLPDLAKYLANIAIAIAIAVIVLE